LASSVGGLRWTIQRTLADLAKGEDGADNPFKVYGRKGTPCPRCRSELERIELGGRTTTFCPGCQVLRRGGPARTSRRRTGTRAKPDAV
jgi:formamidopyrimidine-DNA glycosylase